MAWLSLVGENLAGAQSLNADSIRAQNGGGIGHTASLTQEIFDDELKGENTSMQHLIEHYLAGHLTEGQFSTEMEKLSVVAAEKGETALGYFILSRLYDTIDAFDKALTNIDLAIASDPDSIRYVRSKMLLVFRQASKLGQRDSYLKAIDIGKEAIDLVQNKQSSRISASTIYLDVARLLPDSDYRLQQLKLEYFEKLISSKQVSSESIPYTLWNSISEILLRRGRCHEAKLAAQNSLSSHGDHGQMYGKAQANIRDANACLSEGAINKN